MPLRFEFSYGLRPLFRWQPFQVVARAVCEFEFGLRQARQHSIWSELASIQAESKVVEQRLLTQQKEARNLIIRMKQLEFTEPFTIRFHYAGTSDTLFDYFRLEATFRSGDLRKLDARDSEIFRRLRKEFGDKRTERLFAVWREGGDQAVVRFIEENGPICAPREAVFETCKLPWNYGLFSTPASVRYWR